MNEQIQPISEQTRTELLRKSAYGLSVRPRETGKTAEELKKAFYAPFLDREASLLAEINRLVKEINRILESRTGRGEHSAVVNDSEGGVADAPYAVSLGEGTSADCPAQLAAGRFNRSVDALMVVGCGSDDAHRENACWLTEQDGEVRLYLRGGAYLNEEMLFCLAELSEGRWSLENHALYADEIGARCLHVSETLQADADVAVCRLTAQELHVEKNLDFGEAISAPSVQSDCLSAKKLSVSDELEWQGVPLLHHLRPKRRPLTGTEEGFVSGTHYVGEVSRLDLRRLFGSDREVDSDERWHFTFRLLPSSETSDASPSVLLPKRISWVGGTPSFSVGKLYELSLFAGLFPAWDGEGAYDGDLIGRWTVAGEDQTDRKKRRKK